MSIRIVKARKTYKCSSCGKEIFINEEYYSISNPMYFGVVRQHINCEKVNKK